MENFRPQLHVSMLDQLARCGIQFQRRYGARFGVWPQEEIIPPSITLTIGNTCHNVIENYFGFKIETGGQLPSAESVKDIAATIYAGYIADEISLDDDEKANPKQALDAGKDMAIALSLLHHTKLAPIIQPAAVEEVFVIEMKNFEFDLSGKKDIREIDGNIRDTKTAARSGQYSANSMQMAMYALAERIERGKYPNKVFIDSLIKTKIPKFETSAATPEDKWINPLFRRIERFAEIIESVKAGHQAFMPADPNHWCCSVKYCGYSGSCKYFSGKD